MAIYDIQYQIQSNVPVEELGYQLEIYKTEGNIPRYALHKTPITPLDAEYKTKAHKSLNIEPDAGQHFIIYFMLFRKINGNYQPIFDKPKTKVYSLGYPSTLIGDKKQNINYYETKDTTKLEKEEQVNIHVLKITGYRRPFEDLDFPEGNPEDPFDKNLIEGQLQDRLIGYDYPHQRNTSFCGPAAFFYCLLKDQPAIYEQAVWDLWNYGNTQIGNLQIKPSNNCRHPRSLSKIRITGLDWITLASLRDTENIVLSTKVRDTDTISGFFWEGLAGITTVYDAKTWFEKVGSKCVFDNTMLWSPSGYNHARLKHILDLNLYAGRPNYHVIVLVGSGMFGATSDGTTFNTPSKDHWVVWESRITSINGDDINENTPLTEKVKLKAFSWGKVKDNYIREDIILSDVLNYIFGGFVVTSIL